MTKEFNLLYWNTNYKERYKKSEKEYSKISKFIINKVKEHISNVDVVLFTEGLPQITKKQKEDLSRYYDLDEKYFWQNDDFLEEQIKTDGVFKSFDIFPYGQRINVFDENKKLIFPYAKNLDYLKSRDNKCSFWSKNPIIILTLSKYNFLEKMRNDCIEIVENEKIRIIGVRIGMLIKNTLLEMLKEINSLCYSDIIKLGNYKKENYLYIDEELEINFNERKILETIIGNNTIKSNRYIYDFIDCIKNVKVYKTYNIYDCIQQKKSYDYIIRRIQYNYVKEIIDNLNDKKNIVIGDFNLDDGCNNRLWNYHELINNNLKRDDNFEGYVICNGNTIGDKKMDYVYLKNCNCISKNNVTYFDSIYNVQNIPVESDIKKQYPDHNLLFASIDLGDV